MNLQHTPQVLEATQRSEPYLMSRTKRWNISMQQRSTLNKFKMTWQSISFNAALPTSFTIIQRNSTWRPNVYYMIQLCWTSLNENVASVKDTQRFISAEYLFGRPKSPEIFRFNCSENYRFLWRTSPQTFVTRKLIQFLLFSEGQMCRLECKIRWASIFGKPLAAWKFRFLKLSAA